MRLSALRSNSWAQLLAGFVLGWPLLWLAVNALAPLGASVIQAGAAAAGRPVSYVGALAVSIVATTFAGGVVAAALLIRRPWLALGILLAFGLWLALSYVTSSAVLLGWP